MKYYFLILVTVFLIPTPTHAIELESRLPKISLGGRNAFATYPSLRSSF